MRDTNREILGLYETGSGELTNASQVSASDLIWGLYGISHVFAEAAQHEKIDVSVGLGLAAQALSAALVDRISVEKYVAKPDRPPRPKREPHEVTPEERSRLLAYADHLREIYGETGKEPRPTQGDAS